MIDHFLCGPSFDSFPPWQCPACKLGSLQWDVKSIRRWPHKGTVCGMEEGYLQRGEEDGVFATVLKCSNYVCNQGVAVLGNYSSRIVDSQYATELKHTVRDVYPAIQLIAVPVSTDKIVEAVERSFGLYWRDPQACASAIRTAIEGIAAHLGQPPKQNGKFVSLGTRLKRLKSSHADHADLVEAAEAIKNVGNDGAHGDAVDQKKLLTAYELLEIEMRQLFNDDSTRRQKLITELQT